MTWWRRWLGRGSSPADRAREQWRAEWAAAVADPTEDAVAALKARLASLGQPEEETELEQEMLDGLASLRELHAAPTPVVETGHRAVGTEVCHFSAPAIMPDEPAQPAGRLLFTPTRAVFVGGGKPSTIPWHSVGDVQQAARDVVLVRADRDRVFRFRTNSYAEALCGAHLARRLMPQRSRPI